MGRKARGLWPVAAIAAIVVGAGVLLRAVWRSPHRNDLIACWGLVAAVVTIAAGWMSWAWRTRTKTCAAADRGLLAPGSAPPSAGA